jgi:hypothetical protein
VSVVAFVRDFVYIGQYARVLFCVLCDLSYIRHDNTIYTIVICNLLKHVPKMYELLNTDSAGRSALWNFFAASKLE